ncbi:MAG: hypothetical protein KC591_06940 [Gemmatimonadetes bacterium]|nr:hypothetical protein [Gemmatimonadota bacterium]
MRRPRVLILGLGPIGRAVASAVLDSEDLHLVAAVDPAPEFAGRTLADVLADDRAPRQRVAASLAEVRPRADVVAHLAASRFPTAEKQIRDVLSRRLPVVSTCEELIAARWRWPARARALDRAARDAAVPVLAVGVNPGFAMDVLPAAVANVCVTVSSIEVLRRVDTSRRRRALQDKTGVGITSAEFRRRHRESAIGHVGLRDSLIFLVNHLPLRAEVGEERISPIVAKETVRRRGREIAAGHILGVRHRVDARDASGRVVAKVRLEMQFGHPDPGDEIRIAGDPPLHLKFAAGIPGDRATVGSVLTGLRWAPNASPGLG